MNWVDPLIENQVNSRNTCVISAHLGCCNEDQNLALKWGHHKKKS